MKDKIAQRIRLFKDEGCWLDEDALKQRFICPDEPKCEDCVYQYGILPLIREDIEEMRNPHEEDMITDADYREGWLDCKRWVSRHWRYDGV